MIQEQDAELAPTRMVAYDGSWLNAICKLAQRQLEVRGRCCLCL